MRHEKRVERVSSPVRICLRERPIKPNSRTLKESGVKSHGAEELERHAGDRFRGGRNNVVK